MVRIVYKYYLMFPPIIRKSIDLSLIGLANGIMLDYYVPTVENLLHAGDELITEKIKLN